MADFGTASLTGKSGDKNLTKKKAEKIKFDSLKSYDSIYLSEVKQGDGEGAVFPSP